MLILDTISFVVGVSFSCFVVRHVSMSSILTASIETEIDRNTRPAPDQVLLPLHQTLTTDQTQTITPAPCTRSLYYRSLLTIMENQHYQNK